MIFVLRDLAIWQMTLKNNRYDTSRFRYHFIAIGGFELELQTGNTQFGSNWKIFFLCDLAIWRMTLKNYKAPHLCYFKLFVSFHSHRSIQTGITVQKLPIRVTIEDFSVPCNSESWRMILKNNRATLSCYFKLCVSFHSHQSIHTVVTVQKAQFRSKWFFVPCDIDIWQMTLKN